MRAKLGAWRYVLGACTVILALAFTPVLLRISLVIGGGAYIVATGVILGVWIVALVKSLAPYLQAHGRARFAGRPDFAIGGKHWSLPAVNFLMGAAALATPPVAWAYGRVSGDVVGAGSLCVLAAGFGLAMLRSKRMRLASRAALLNRDCIPMEELWEPVLRGRRDGIEALDCVERVMAVPRCHLRPNDRFGAEVGSLSFFDESLDILTARLLQSRPPPRWFDPRAVGTLTDYVDAWVRLRGRAG